MRTKNLGTKVSDAMSVMLKQWRFKLRDNVPYITCYGATGKTYCNAAFDGYLCWPPTPAGQVAAQNCPPVRLSDTSNLAFRKCGSSGMWLTKRSNETSLIGWTNYTPCFPAQVQNLLGKVYDDEDDAQIKFKIALGTRYMEIAGFSLSLIALLISLRIFSYYRSLRNNRTRIHKSLFTAMVVQVLIRLIVYIDQAVTRKRLDDQIDKDEEINGIDNMPYVCEATYTLLEYAISVMFMWMLIEGLYLHNMVVTVNALREKVSHLAYLMAGWGLPVVCTGVWALATALHYRNENVNICWYGYNFTSIYWIIQGPRLGIIAMNLVFLVNIMRVLILKLHQSESTEIEKVRNRLTNHIFLSNRKGVRAALVLLPLLGITNVLNMIEAPLDSGVWRFGIWSYSTHFLRSFQGLFIALIYCFFNGEVRQVLKKHYSDYMAMRTPRRGRNSIFNLFSTSGEQRPSLEMTERPSAIGMKTLKLLRAPKASGEDDVEAEKEDKPSRNKKDSGVCVGYSTDGANEGANAARVSERGGLAREKDGSDTFSELSKDDV